MGFSWYFSFTSLGYSITSRSAVKPALSKFSEVIFRVESVVSLNWFVKLLFADCSCVTEAEKLNKMSSLLERLHTKYSQNRPWTETMKLVRQVMVRLEQAALLFSWIFRSLHVVFVVSRGSLSPEGCWRGFPSPNYRLIASSAAEKSQTCVFCYSPFQDVVLWSSLFGDFGLVKNGFEILVWVREGGAGGRGELQQSLLPIIRR